VHYSETTLAPEENTEKIARYLARCGIASRRKCEEYIRAGWVRLNGEVVITPESRINPGEVVVQFQGKVIQPPTAHRYILMNKPVGFLSTCKTGKEKGRTVLNLVKVPERIFPAGRLDRDTSGLLLLTNDGELVHRLLHPSFEIEREYLIETGRDITTTDIHKLNRGVLLDDGFSRFIRVDLKEQRSLLIVLAEGRKRQIRRTLKAIGVPILTLHRIRFGNLTLGKLPSGQWRELTPSEILSLKT
jgi:23S rRNA pseudouridine2605 synthase